MDKASYKIISITPLKLCEDIPFCDCEINTTEGIKRGAVSNSMIEAFDKKGLVIWRDDENE